MVKLGWMNFCFQLQLILYFFFTVGQRARDPQGSIWIFLGTFSVITLTFCCGREELHVPGISWTEGFLHPIQRCKAADFFHKTCTICFIYSVYIYSVLWEHYSPKTKDTYIYDHLILIIHECLLFILYLWSRNHQNFIIHLIFTDFQFSAYLYEHTSTNQICLLCLVVVNFFDLHRSFSPESLSG